LFFDFGSLPESVGGKLPKTCNMLENQDFPGQKGHKYLTLAEESGMGIGGDLALR
jgi:hypothetical protein